jgi:hypothetical protein
MIRLMKHLVDPEKCTVLYDRPFTAASLEEDFEVKGGKWYVEDGWLVGENRENSAAMVMSKGEYFGNVLIEFHAETVLPATRDINLTFHGSWDEEKNIRDVAYVFGLEGWYQGFVGFEKSPEYKFVVNTALLDFVPGKRYHIVIGNIENCLFVAVDGKVALEVRDPDPIDFDKYGRVGFEAFCTRVRYTDVKIKRCEYIDDFSLYTPEF